MAEFGGLPIPVAIGSLSLRLAPSRPMTWR